MPIRQQGNKIPQIDREKLLDKEFTDLEPHERRWLQDTEFWPEGATPEPVTFYSHTGEVISNDPAFLLLSGDRNSALLDQLVEARAQQLLLERTGEAPPVPNLGDDLEVPEPGTHIREIPYEQMKIQELRGEALSRGLSIDGEAGQKANLVTALEAWDEEHEDGDDDEDDD